MSTPEEFLKTGQNIITTWANATRQLREWSEAYEQRGGQPVLGNDALNIVSFVNNPLQTWLNDANQDALHDTIAKQRTDY